MKFRADLGQEFVTITDDNLRRVRDEFLNAEASRGRDGPDAAARATPGASASRRASGRAPGPRRRAARRPRTRRSSPATKLPFPVYYPKDIVRGGPLLRRLLAPTRRARTTSSTTRSASTAPTAWSSRRPGIGEYYGIQGTDWKDPPIIANPSATMKAGGRKLLLFRDGSRLRLVAWKTDNARLLGLEHAAALADEPADARHRPLADPRRPRLANLSALRMSSTARTHRRHRHRLRRPRHRGRLRRARQRRLVHRHRRRQDRAPQARRDPDLRARPRGARRQAPRPPALLDRHRRRARARAPAVRRRRHAAVVLGRRRPQRRLLGRRGDAAVGRARAGHEVDRARSAPGAHDQAPLRGDRPRRTSATSRARSSSRRARRSRTSSTPTASSSATTATGPATRCEELYAPLERADPAHGHRLGRDGQARVQRVPRDEDLVHQRDRQRLGGDRAPTSPRSRAAWASTTASGRSSCSPASASAARASRRTSARSSSSRATRATTSSCSRRSSRSTSCRSAASSASSSARSARSSASASRCSAWRSSRTPTTCARRPRSCSPAGCRARAPRSSPTTRSPRRRRASSCARRRLRRLRARRASRGADAVVLVTEWPQFARARLDARSPSAMRGDVVIDGRNALDPETRPRRRAALRGRRPRRRPASRAEPAVVAAPDAQPATAGAGPG